MIKRLLPSSPLDIPGLEDKDLRPLLPTPPDIGDVQNGVRASLGRGIVKEPLREEKPPVFKLRLNH